MFNDEYDNLCRLIVRFYNEHKNDRDVFCGCIEYLSTQDAGAVGNARGTQPQNEKY